MAAAAASRVSDRIASLNLLPSLSREMKRLRTMEEVEDGTNIDGGGGRYFFHTYFERRLLDLLDLKKHADALEGPASSVVLESGSSYFGGSRTTNTGNTPMRIGATNMANRPLLLSKINQTTAPRECKTCNRQFPSLQALGGHWASHKKPKLVHNKQTQGPVSSVREHRGIRDIELGLPYFGGSRTTNTGSTPMGDGGRHDQDPKTKEFRKVAYLITPLSITFLVGLLSANKRQPELLFRSCSSLAFGATICSIAMLMLILICPSSQRARTCAKMMLFVAGGMLFVALVLAFTFTLL